MRLASAFRKFVKREAVRIALRRPAPIRIPTSGEAVNYRNYYVVYFDDEQGRLWAEKLTPSGVEGVWFNRGNDVKHEACIPNRMLSDCDIGIHLYRGRLGLQYSSALEFIVHYYTFFPRLKIWCDGIAQSFFNRQQLVRRDRIEILRSILEGTLVRDDFNTDSLRVADSLYGPRWIEHPENERLRRYYDFLLDSLVESGDLVGRQSSDYRLAPKALATLAQFEADDRRHRDLVRLQAVLIGVTAALVIVGLVQAAVAYFGG